MTITANNSILGALTPNLNPHRAAPAGPRTPVAAPRTQAEIATGRSDLSDFVKVDDGRAMPGKTISMDGSSPVATQSDLARYAADMQRHRATMASQSAGTSDFRPAHKQGGCSGETGVKGMGGQYALMSRSTPQLRKEAQKVGQQLVFATLRGDTAGAQQLTARLKNIGDILNNRSVPNAPTDLTPTTKYGKALTKMSNEELNSEFSLQSARAFIANGRGDKAGAADAMKKLQACNAEVQTRGDNALGGYMEQLGGMTDAEVVQANQTATVTAESQANTPVEAQPAGVEGDDFGKVVASAAEMVKRSIEESVTAPFKFLGGLFGF
jgi:hypothetical protein